MLNVFSLDSPLPLFSDNFLFQGPSRGVTSVKSKDTSSIVIGGLSICDGETWRFCSDCFYNSMKYKPRPSADSHGDSEGSEQRLLSQSGEGSLGRKWQC
jgi:hypothetical protein